MVFDFKASKTLITPEKMKAENNIGKNANLVDWMVNLSWTSPIENRWPSTVQMEMPHLSLGTRANCGM